MIFVKKCLWHAKRLLTELICISLLKTFYFNFLSTHVERKGKGILIIYKKTKLYFEKNAKIIVENGPLKLGGGKPIGSYNASLIRIQENSIMHAYGNCTIEYNADVLLKPNAKFIMSKNSYINCKCVIRCSKYISIGEGSITATELDLRDSDGHELNGKLTMNPTRIGNHVWIGTRVTILEGVTIADGSMIGACSLVTKDIPEKCLAYGVPAYVKQTNIEWKY